MGIESVGGGQASLNLSNSPEPGYTVERGDTLSSIARDHGIALNDLIAANPQIRNPNLIYPDQHVNLPSGAARGGEGTAAAMDVGATASVASTYTGGALDRVQLAQVFHQAGFRGEPLVQMVAIAMRESGGDPRAFNGNAGTGDRSYGLTQINMIGNLGPARREQLGLPSNEALFDPVVNARAAFVLSGNGNDLSPWGGYKGMSNTYNTDMPAARAAVAQAQAEGLLGQPFAGPAASASPAQATAATQPVLREGARGDSVEDLQRSLKAAGFNPGPVDGWFGPQTERAVLSFQSSRGITVDGVVGPQTWGQLHAATSQTLDRGDRGAAVSVLQGRLQDLGYSPGPVDGIFGPRTEAAVKAFQRDRGIAVDGIAGPQTWGQINGSPPPTANPPVVVPEPTGNVPLTNDAATNRAIATLHPEIREQAAQFVNRVEQELGIQLRITSGFRSFAEQDALYAQGRTRPGDVVTNARGGQSNHNYGLAFDVVEVNPNGTVNWNTDWSAIGRVGQSMGFEWGGAWTSFVDRPHFQMTFGLSTSQLLARHNAGQTDGGFVRVR